MRILIINNLASGFGSRSIYDFIRYVSEDGMECVIRSTDGTTDLKTFLHDVQTFDAVVAAGGDGTVTTILSELAYTQIPVLPFPAGTANLLALNLLSPDEPHALAKQLKEMKYLDFDLGEIKKDETSIKFAIMAGAGYDANIMKAAEKNKKQWGQVAYFQAAIANSEPIQAKMKLTLDGNEFDTKGFCVLAVNFSKLQFDIPVLHENKPNNGKLSYIVLNGDNAYSLIPALHAAILDIGGDNPKRPSSMEIYEGEELHVECDPPLDIQFDGEIAHLTTPFSVRVLPHAARIIVSSECIAEFRI